MDESELQKLLAKRRLEHRDLDMAINALLRAGEEGGFVDQLQIARLKKKKLTLRDRITRIEDDLLPDIIA